ncbi:hypothetical protein QBC35DRAFT_477978 [Podospora australis]|uniref:Uncharacterized protein n=1 Tax=Podospora australis TaxID=1536484 RepID=A0AAN6WKJ5_9PEZI|nr:hypothetical protein QBC35DRAFT_477978 [Podospora australis]
MPQSQQSTASQDETQGEADWAIVESSHSVSPEPQQHQQLQPKDQQYENRMSAIDGAAIWRVFELRRRSAEYYVNQYLDYLADDFCSSDDDDDDDDDEQPSTSLAASDSKMTTRLKISADTAIRDLKAMENIISDVQGILAIQSKPKVSPATVVCTTALGAIPCLLIAPVKVVLAAAALVTAGYTVPPKLFYWGQDVGLERSKSRVKALRVAFEEHDIETLQSHWYQGDLGPGSFMSLDWTCRYFLATGPVQESLGASERRRIEG